MKNALRCLPSVLLVSGALAACSDAASTGSGDDDLTSVTARSRELTFESMVYVDADAGDAEIMKTVRAQAQTAFGALKNAEVGVNSRELKSIDASTFRKTPVDVLDPTRPGAAPKRMQRVVYRYVDDAIVPVAHATRSSLGLAVMNASYKTQEERVFRECTTNDDHAREMTGAVWYVFDPSLPRCREAIAAEQRRIDADRERLTNAQQVAASEVDRLYVPITVSFGPDKTNRGKSYPEYHRLWAGGVQPGKLVIGLVNGLIDHGGDALWTDAGMTDFMTTVASLLSSRPGWKMTRIEPQEDLSTLTLSSGKRVTGLSFDDFIIWKLAGTPHEGLSEAEQKEAGELAAKKFAHHYITWQAPVKVAIGDGTAKDFTIELQAYFGADSDPAPHKRLIKSSDVFVYNGHSNIGYGPLDPSNFTAADFPASYQILFIDSCVSYNYYEKDYIPLKRGGTKNLDLVTNGLETPAYRSGDALGNFLVTLTNGKQASWLELLEKAAATDRLRVVDGELDNEYSPEQTPIVVSKPE